MERHTEYQKAPRQGAAFQWKEGDEPIKIYTDYEFLAEGLTSARFKRVNNW
jgi:hypothetical protein